MYDLQPLVDLLERWGGFESFENPGRRYLEEERDYKVEASAATRKLFDERALREAVAARAIADLRERYTTFIAEKGYTNLFDWRDSMDVLDPLLESDDAEERLVSFFAAVADLHRDDADISEVADRMAFALRGEEAASRKGHMWAVVSYVAMMIRPDLYVFVKPGVSNAFFKWLRVPDPRPTAFTGKAYAAYLEVCRALSRSLAEFGCPPKDMIDLQCAMWIVGRVLDEQRKSGREPVRELIREAVTALSANASGGVTGAAIRAYMDERHPRSDGRNWLGNMVIPGDYAVWEHSGEPCNPSAASDPNYPKFLICAEHQGERRYRLKERPMPQHPESTALSEHFRASGLWFSSEAVTNYALALKTKPFVILTGISGTGKTKLAQIFAEAFADSQRCAFISVRPDWTDNRGLLGYYNPLTERYVPTEFLKLMLRAAKDPDHPYLVILDEMNLARVEHYFSDFLSCLESRRTGATGIVQDALQLHHEPAALPCEDEFGETYEVPRSLEIPLNLYFTGTVNVDETTYMFSPKVLDRANTIEFNHVDLGAYAGLAREERPDGAFRLRGEFTLGAAPVSTKADFDALDTGTKQLLVTLNGILAPAQLHFGYRVANEIALYLLNARELVGDDGLETAIDLQLLQKVLPKFHGSRAKLEKPLLSLLRFCLDGTAGEPGWARANQERMSLSADQRLEVDGEPVRFSRTGGKVYRMLDALQDQGYASFIV